MSKHVRLNDIAGRKSWYHPARIAAAAMGAGVPMHDTAWRNFVSSVPVVGTIADFVDPASESEWDLAHRKPVKKKFDSTLGYPGEGPPKKGKSKKGKGGAKGKSKRSKRNVKFGPKGLGRKKPSGKVIRGVQNRVNESMMAIRRARALPLRLVSGPQRFRSVSTGRNHFSGKIFLGEVRMVSSPAFPTQFTSLFRNNAGGSPGNVLTQLPLSMNYMSVNPYSISAFQAAFGNSTKMAKLTDFYERWTGRFKLIWQPQCSETQPGQFCWYVDKDPADDDTQYLGQQQLMTKGTDVGSRMQNYSKPATLSFGSNKLMWCRQGLNANVRDVSAGHVMCFTVTDVADMALGGVYGILGTLSLEYEIELSVPCSDEMSLNTEFATTTGTETGSTSYAWTPAPTDQLQPISSVIVANQSTTLPNYGVPNGVCLNANFVTPAPTYIQVQVLISNTLTTDGVVAHLYSSGVDISGTNLSYDWQFVSSSTTGHLAGYGFTLCIPENTPLGTVFLTLSHTANATLTSAWSVWFLRSELFGTDFVSLPTLTHHSHVVQALKKGELVQPSRLDDEEKRFEAWLAKRGGLHVTTQFSEEKQFEVVEPPSPVPSVSSNLISTTHFVPVTTITPVSGGVPKKKSSTKSDT